MDIATHCFKPAENVRSVAVDEHLVLVDQKTGQYFGLNEVGREIWTLVEQGCDATTIAKTIADQFDAPEAVIADDTKRLLGELAQAGLVV